MDGGVVDPLMTPVELAEMLGVSVKKLQRMRTAAPPEGPDFVMIGRYPRYRRLDVAAWLKRSTVSTKPVRL
ncbi:helix-turn-helix domain-containing protein [Frankia sp. AgW1.1]|uniref:helix-turn-helix domain-containing protein n=1 Tax=Frankia sp. AgW1.1 TaxID=1836971 RepID=UPI0019326265|nr:helix-turn-helix domain-containing protein [Frankia sp. AgW1.1]MBL7487167.1 helix-turn-helix domain-containing protein [Frankia sp. AgW1.1]